MSYPNLNLLLQAANRRQLFLGLARSCLLSASVLLLGLFLALVLDAIFAFPVWALLILDVLLVALVLWGLTKVGQVIRRARFDPRRVARLLEQQLNLTDNALINAVDLREPTRGQVSRRLADESIKLGEAAARRVDLTQAIVARPARRAAWCAVWTLAGAAIAYLIMPGVFARGLPRLLDPSGGHPPYTLVRFDVEIQPERIYYGSAATITAKLSGPVALQQADVVMQTDGITRRMPMMRTDAGYRLDIQRTEAAADFYIDTPQGRSDRYRLDVQQVPLLTDVWVSYQYPPHTDWAPRRHPLVGRDIEALKDTEVTLEASSGFPLSQGHVEIFTGQHTDGAPDVMSLLPVPDDSQRVRGSFRLKESGRLSLQLVGHNQVRGPEVREARLVVLEDQPPQVSIVDPEPIALAVEGWQIPVTVEASDDVEVADVRLDFQFNDQSSQALPLATDPSGRRHARGQAQFDLADLGAQAGDRIRFSASAVDNHPDAAQTAHSESHEIQVISPAQYLDYLRSTYQLEQLADEIQQLNDRLEQLKEDRDRVLDQSQQLQSQLTEQQGRDGQQREQLDNLQDRLSQYTQQAVDISEQAQERLELPQLYDAERAYRDQLRQLAEQLRQQQEVAERLQAAVKSVAQEETPSAEDIRRWGEAQQQMQQQGEPFATATRQDLAESERQAEQLMRAEKMVAEAKRIQQVTQEQRQVAERLQQLPEDDANPSDEQRRADGLARQQERLQQQLQEAQRYLREAAEQSATDLPRTAGDACKLCDAIDQQGIASDQQQAARSARQGSEQRAAESAQQAAEKLESLAKQGPTSQGAGEDVTAEDVDQGLRLSAEDVQRTMQQLAEGRSSPSLGPASLSPSSPATNRSPGAMSRFGLHGPQPPRDAFQAQRGRPRPDHTASGDHNEIATDSDIRAEMIEAASRTEDGARASYLRGVPVGYRAEAEAYFRRLAEDPRRTDFNPSPDRPPQFQTTP